MSNSWIVVVARDNLDLLRAAVESFDRQDADGGVHVLCVDNGSGPDVVSWLRYRTGITSIHFNPQHSVARAWNAALKYLFSLGGSRFVERVLVCNSDVVLRPDTWRLLESEQADFVTGVGNSNSACISGPHPIPNPDAKRPHPDFSCFMISRWCYAKVGEFDEQFLGAFCEDSDYHCRMYNAGVAAYAIDLPFLHVGGGSQTIKRAAEFEQEQISKRAAVNRGLFKRKWGFEVGSESYYAFFGTCPPDVVDGVVESRTGIEGGGPR